MTRFDVSCAALARHFLQASGYEPEVDSVASLAEAIQEAIDAWFTANESDDDDGPDAGEGWPFGPFRPQGGK